MLRLAKSLNRRHFNDETHSQKSCFNITGAASNNYNPEKMKTLNYRLHSNRNRDVIQMKFEGRAAYLSLCRRGLELDVNRRSVISSGFGSQVLMTNIHFLVFILRILMVLLIFHLYCLYAVMLICSIIYCSPGRNKYFYE